MRIKKYKGDNWVWYKTDNKTLHGLYNVENLLIGYFYKHKPKGFYLDYYKR
jgi:hypothetical protein